MEKCPKCGKDLLITVICNDISGNDIINLYHCEYCKEKLTEEDILKYKEIKQYIVEEAYTGNVKVTSFTNGKCDNYEIINDYALSTYTDILENNGYKRAYDVDEAKAIMESKKEEYEEAVKWYEYAKKNALIKIGGM